MKGGNPNMMYEAMFNIVQDAAMKHQQRGAYITPEDTVCVICSTTQKVYTGISRVEMRGGQPMNVHAEIVAMPQMQAAEDEAAPAENEENEEDDAQDPAGEQQPSEETLPEGILDTDASSI